MSDNFRVGVSRDFHKPDGSLGFDDLGLRKLEEVTGVEWDFLHHDPPKLNPQQIEGCDALIILGGTVVTSDLVKGAERLAIVARFGVGYDNVDVEACTSHGVLVTITPDGVRRPVASSFMAFMLALSHNLVKKDRITRSGHWEHRLDDIGIGMTGRVLGLIGFGNIGRDLVRLTEPFAMRRLACDPFVCADQMTECGVEPADLDTLLRTADFVCLCCKLTEQTRHLIDSARLALMKNTAYLINLARGPVVDQQALTAALNNGSIGGAAIDVYDPEPVARDDDLLALDNVIVTPHSVCMTDECFRGNGNSASESILEVAAGRIPRHTVNTRVTESTRLREKLRQYEMRRPSE